MYGTVWVYQPDDFYKNDAAGDELILGPVYSGEGTIDPEVWAREHGVDKFPHVIYFFAELVNLEV